jgi:hypothetical protein
MNGDSRQNRRAASSRFNVPTAFTSKSIERDRRGQVVRRLGRGVNDDRGPERADQFEHARAVADVQFVVGEARQSLLEALLIPAGVALRAKEGFALVVVHAVNSEAAPVKKGGHFRANQPRGAGDENLLSHSSKTILPGVAAAMAAVRRL